MSRLGRELAALKREVGRSKASPLSLAKAPRRLKISGAELGRMVRIGQVLVSIDGGQPVLTSGEVRRCLKRAH